MHDHERYEAFLWPAKDREAPREFPNPAMLGCVNKTEIFGVPAGELVFRKFNCSGSRYPDTVGSLEFSRTKDGESRQSVEFREIAGIARSNVRRVTDVLVKNDA